MPSPRATPVPVAAPVVQVEVEADQAAQAQVDQVLLERVPGPLPDQRALFRTHFGTRHYVNSCIFSQWSYGFKELDPAHILHIDQH